MDSKKSRAVLLGAVVTIVLVGLVVAGCKHLMPRHGWNEKAWGPLVPHTKFPGDCSLCHVPDRWDKLHEDFIFHHEKETGYPLQGAHAQAACLRCHNDRGPVQAYVSRGCAGCHVDPHASDLGMDCTRCHSETSWKAEGLVAEHARTRFPLVGVHVVASCESCHEGAAAGEFRGAPLQCEICHQEDLMSASDPDHIANGWITDCQQCHNPVSWTGANIRHDFFPLTGGHGGLDCSQCHTVPGIFSGQSSDCYSCHATDYQGAPNHVAQNFSINCEQCHSTTAWTPATFHHTSFPLTGGHVGLSCAACHSGGVYAGLPTDCDSCHATDYQSAPDHASLGFPRDCTACHSTAAWTPAMVQHAFPLTGNHNVSCVTCHDSGSITTFTCFNCHAHTQAEADSEHSEVNGYVYNSQACYSCHPNGQR